MPTKFRQSLPTLTIVALITGLMLGLLLQGRMHTSRPLSEREFLHELDMGTHMPVLITSPELDSYASDSARVAQFAADSHSLSIHRGQVIIPDSYSGSFYNCSSSGGHAFFKGEVADKYQVFTGAKAGDEPTEDHDLSSRFHAIGTVFKCEGLESRVLVATGVGITAPIHQTASGELNVVKRTAWASFTGFVANLYLTFLLMLFLPTLALSLVKSIVESASSSRHFRFAVVYFVASSLIAAAVGSVAALCFTKLATSHLAPGTLQTVAQSLGSRQLANDYDPNPILTQLGHIIPNNPLGALTDPSGNSGLQVAFIAIVLGMILATMNAPTRANISAKLKGLLGVVISDRDLQWRALSDYADSLAPVGVFFLALTTFSTMDYGLLHDLAALSVVIFVALAIHVVLLVIWLALRRSFADWVKKGLLPGFNGLVTAFATSSSYAALPAITGVPLLAENPSARGIFDIGTTLNKNGTAVYLGASATFLYLYFGTGGWHILVPMVLMSALAGTVVAGLPFAAIFGLQMILSAFGIPSALAWLILPIDPIADRLVTAVNVLANLAGCSSPKRRANSLESGFEHVPAGSISAAEVV